MGVEEVMKLVVEKLKETNLSVLDALLAWFDKFFPPGNWPDKFRHWLHVATPFLIAAVALPLIFCLLRCFFGLILSILLSIFGFIFSLLRCILGFIFPPLRCIFGFIFRFVRCCCVGIFRFFRFYCCFCCFGRGGGWAGKMMKAPGRGGALIPRHMFECDPKAYFFNLRASR